MDVERRVGSNAGGNAMGKFMNECHESADSGCQLSAYFPFEFAV